MSIQQASVKITGIAPLLQNNPQTVDPFNAYAKAKKAITNKRTAKTEDDLFELGNLETEAKIYFDEKIGIDPKRLLAVTIMPCNAKKSECTLPTMRGEDGIPDVDVSITTRELDIMLRANHISPVHLPEEEFDSPLGSGTGAASRENSGLPASQAAARPQ